MKGVYSFHWDYGRSGDVEGSFVATTEQVANVVGKHVYFGEILGKHSEVYGTLSEGDIILKSDDPDFVAKWEELNMDSGYNPIDYIKKWIVSYEIGPVDGKEEFFDEDEANERFEELSEQAEGNDEATVEIWEE